MVHHAAGQRTDDPTKQFVGQWYSEQFVHAIVPAMVLISSMTVVIDLLCDIAVVLEQYHKNIC